jgi:hypothetical protein
LSKSHKKKKRKKMAQQAKKGKGTKRAFNTTDLEEEGKEKEEGKQVIIYQVVMLRDGSPDHIAAVLHSFSTLEKAVALISEVPIGKVKREKNKADKIMRSGLILADEPEFDLGIIETILDATPRRVNTAILFHSLPQYLADRAKLQELQAREAAQNEEIHQKKQKQAAESIK